MFAIVSLMLGLTSCQKEPLGFLDHNSSYNAGAGYNTIAPDTNSAPAKLKVHFKRSDIKVRNHCVEYVYDENNPMKYIDIYAADTTITYTVVGNTYITPNWVVVKLIMQEQFSKTIFCPILKQPP